jgi:hypothetical protein
MPISSSALSTTGCVESPGLLSADLASCRPSTAWWFPTQTNRTFSECPQSLLQRPADRCEIGSYSLPGPTRLSAALSTELRGQKSPGYQGFSRTQPRRKFPLPGQVVAVA